MHYETPYVNYTYPIYDTKVDHLGEIVSTGTVLDEGDVVFKDELSVKPLAPDIPLPSYAHPTDAGLDLHAISVEAPGTVIVATCIIQPGMTAKVHTGIAIKLPHGTSGAARLGFYPGTRNEKLLDSQIGNMLGAKLGDTLELKRYIDANEIQLLPFSDLRGFDTTGKNCAVYITEAQNLDIEMMRLALQRIGEDSICIIDGDYDAQVDLDIYSGDNNGMRRLSQVFRGQDFYGEVKLQKIYRSRIAALAQEM